MIAWADLAGVSTPEVRAMLVDAERNDDEQVADVCRGVIAFREPESARARALADIKAYYLRLGVVSR